MDFVTFENTVDMMLSYFGEGLSLYDRLVMSLIIAALCFAVVYIFQAVALYTIASREGYKSKWMAFVPFFNIYYIGVVSEKNKVFKTSAKSFSLALCFVELALVVLYAVYFASAGVIFAGGFYEELIEYTTFGGQQIEVVIGYRSVGVPQPLAWAGWFFDWSDAIITCVELAYIVLNVFVLIAFFQTYSSRHYVLFALVSILFPIKGIMFFVVRNNRARNYREYVREQQQRQFRMYQQYNRQNTTGNPYNYNPYTGQPINHEAGNPYQQPGHGSGAPQSDPFDDFASSPQGNPRNGGQSSGGAPSEDPGDPFADL